MDLGPDDRQCYACKKIEKMNKEKTKVHWSIEKCSNCKRYHCINNPMGVGSGDGCLMYPCDNCGNKFCWHSMRDKTVPRRCAFIKQACSRECAIELGY
jgi:hypothetical protein